MVLRAAAVVAVAFLCVGGAEPAPADLKAEMRKLDWLVGRWEGEGWIQTGPQRQEFAGTETVQRKVGGLSLLIEGLFRKKGAGPDAPPVHETLAVLSYDPERRHYWMSAWLRTGRSGKYEARAVSDTEMHWFIPLPEGQGQVRYTIKLDDRQRWSEVGEMSPDGGKTWRKFFDMTLARVGE